MPEKTTTGENFGTPVYGPVEAPAPETRFEYLVPEKAAGDFGTPEYSPIDPNYRVPEVTFDYFMKEFASTYVVEPPAPIPTTYPEVRFTYYTPPRG